jgi:predicted acetyltransferase
MFHFFHIVFDVLKSQMGAGYVEEAVQTFILLFGEQQLTQALVTSSNNTTASRVVERFLSILTFIVSEPGPSFRHTATFLG